MKPIFLILSLLWFLASCSHIPFLAVPKTPPTIEKPSVKPQKPTKPTPVKPKPIKEKYNISLILPTNHQSSLRHVAQQMKNAAQMAITELDSTSVNLSFYKTDGTEKTTIPAIKKAIKKKADLILGPLTSPSVNVARPFVDAANIPMIAFSSDRNVVGGPDHTFLLSYLAEHDVSQIVQYAAQRGHKKYAFIGSSNPYSSRVLERYRHHVRKVGGKITHVAAINPGAPDMWLELKKVTGKNQNDFSAVLFSDNALQLMRTLPLLEAQGFSLDKHLLMGTGIWHEANALNLYELENAVFAAPDHRRLSVFEKRYSSVFRGKPSQVSTLTYDAIALSMALIKTYKTDPFSLQKLRSPRGFMGIGGVFRFDENGLAERKLNVLRIHNNNFEVVRPADVQF